MRISLQTIVQSLEAWTAVDARRAVAPFDAVGQWLAAPVTAPHPVPLRAIALRNGYGVRSLDLIGASPHDPVPLRAEPIAIGQSLPPGTDAVIEPGSIERQGALLTAIESVEPGAGVRRSGHDVAKGAVLAGRGQRVTPELALATAMAGIATVEVQRLTGRVALNDPAMAQWFQTRLAALGFTVADGPADIDIVQAPAATQRLALSSAEDCVVSVAGGSLRIAIAPLPAAAMAVWCALILPAIATRLGVRMKRMPVRLNQKIASSLGMTDVALLRSTGSGAEVLATGDLPLAAIAEADSFVLIDASSEGEALGARVDAIALCAPFLPAEKP